MPDQNQKFEILPDGTIVFRYIGDGTTALGWLERLTEGHSLVEPERFMAQFFRSPEFTTTPTGMEVTIHIIPASFFAGKKVLSVEDFHAEAGNRNLRVPYHDAVCIAREMLTDQDIDHMGLFWLASSDPINGFYVSAASVGNLKSLTTAPIDLLNDEDRRGKFGFAYEF